MAAYFDPVTTLASVGHIDHPDGQPQNSLLYLTQRFEIETVGVTQWLISRSGEPSPGVPAYAGRAV